MRSVTSLESLLVNEGALDDGGGLNKGDGPLAIDGSLKGGALANPKSTRRLSI